MTESSFRKLLLRFALVPFFSVCAFLAVLGFEIREIALRRLAGSQSTSILLQGNRLEKSMLDEEIGIRGYLASGDPLLLQPYREGSGRFYEELSELKTVASPDQNAAQEVADISEGYKRFDAVNQQLLTGGDGTAALFHQQKVAMDALRAKFDDLNHEQNSIRESNRRALTKLIGRLPAIAIWGSALMTALIVWYGITLFRRITRAFEQQLQETELQRDSLQTTLQSIGDGVVVCDNAGRITMMNETAENLTGWGLNEAARRSLTEVFKIVNEETRLPVENPAEKAARLNRVISLENHTVLLRRDGTEVPIDDSGAPIRNRDGTVSGTVLVFRSVAEQRQTLNLIKKSQERLNSIYNTSLEYVGILNVEGKVLDCNQASLEFAGNTREDVLGKYFWDCPWFIYTEGMPELVRRAIERAATGEAARTQLALIRPSGETVNFDFSLTPVFDADGKVVYLVPEGRDISELKRAEQALMQSEKLAAVGRLAASIAHEINNPLEAVTNLLYLARNLPSSPEVDEYLNQADRELRRVSVIASQTLRFHRQSSNPEPIEAEELFSTVLSIYEGRIRSANISVEVSYRAEQPIVCFAGDVRQVLNNLVGNAIDAMSNCRGRLLLRSHVSRDWGTDRKGIVFTVADNGSGITETDMKKVFEPFFTTKGFGGTGLGLWVSKEVVSRHEGTLKARSSSGPARSGTVFRFFLPFEDSRGTESGLTLSTQDAMLGG
jgi:PAS domain S-box-containing protein